ncbi:MAG: hypothetical protein E5X34_25410 [Mesorhizobium sp.]|uniref:HipA domain-containing protein n=1 Tax=Mesorhizobium sp. TaxID=1871066 RepID=UPI0012142A12|nr:HipA domain-containing protein [Mesorhizobium sp.]TIR16672.1 MAG: hypothetical protein E5X34_25410 [Mesorhizobium sp.]
MFPVYNISDFVSQRPESLGTKEKTWVLPSEGHELVRRPHLFKIGRPNTGENWAEKVSFELCKLLGIPCASYDFARIGDVKGVVSERFMPDAAQFIPGNMLLARVVDGYDGNKRFQQIDYKIGHVLNLIKRLRGLRKPVGWEEELKNLSATEVFVGYLLFDALIGNTDRHHENWGVVVNVEKENISVHLAPSFDHASSLGRNEPAEKRSMRLTTKDHRATVEAYAERGKSAFFGSNTPGTLHLCELVDELVKVYPEATQFWATRIGELSEEAFSKVFGQIGEEWIDEGAARFAIRMLCANQAMILGATNV